MLGASLLWFGWFGFNAGGSHTSLAAATLAFMMAHTPTATAAVVWAALDWTLNRRPSVAGAATGVVAGLSTITAASGFVAPRRGVVIGLGPGFQCYGAVWMKTRVRLVDSLDIWAVHGVGGTRGMLANGLFIGVGFMITGELTDLSRDE